MARSRAALGSEHTELSHFSCPAMEAHLQTGTRGSSHPQCSSTEQRQAVIQGEQQLALAACHSECSAMAFRYLTMPFEPDASTKVRYHSKKIIIQTLYNQLMQSLECYREPILNSVPARTPRAAFIPDKQQSHSPGSHCR